MEMDNFDDAKIFEIINEIQNKPNIWNHKLKENKNLTIKNAAFYLAEKFNEKCTKTILFYCFLRTLKLF